MTEPVTLPPLPRFIDGLDFGGALDIGAEMRAYATAAVLADRQARPDAKDAERYRWLRNQKESLFYLFPEEEVGGFGACVDLAAFPQFDALDAAIDKKLAED